MAGRDIVRLALAAIVLAAPAARAQSAPLRAAEPTRTTAVSKASAAERITATGQRYSFNGEIGVVVPGNLLVSDFADGTPLAANRQSAQWRWASVTKQVTAVLVMQEVSRGAIDLDAPVSRYLPRFRSPNAASLTVRQLLQHRSGLPNPDSTPPNAQGVPSFYTFGFKGDRDPLGGFCAGTVLAKAGGNWTYNNCDFIVAGALLEAVTGRTFADLVQSRIAKPLGLRSVSVLPAGASTRSGHVGGKAEPAYNFTAFGAAAALAGSAADLLKFDLALLSGVLLPPAALAEMWDGQPDLGSIALGQWAFEFRPAGCPAPLRIIERRGAIGGVQVRNFIVPERQLAAVAFTDQAEFDFGEVWQGTGFSHDLLAALACKGVPA